MLQQNFKRYKCKIRTIIFSLRYTLYDGGYNFATLLYAVYSDVNGWTVQMEKE